MTFIELSTGGVAMLISVILMTFFKNVFEFKEKKFGM